MLDEIGLHDSVSSNDVYRDCAPVVGQLDWAVRLVGDVECSRKSGGVIYAASSWMCLNPSSYSCGVK